MPVFDFRKSDQDLFRESTMTFGEHLEDLRGRLFKAVVGLVIGFLVGLWFGQSLVDFIQSPLRQALIDYYEGVSAKQIRRKYEEARNEGRPLPAGVDQLVELGSKHKLLADEVLIQPSEVLQGLPELYVRASREQAGHVKTLTVGKAAIGRLKRPAGDATGKLSDEQWADLKSGWKLLRPAAPTASGTAAPARPPAAIGMAATPAGPTISESDWTRILQTIDKKEPLKPADLALAERAIDGELGRRRASAARLAQDAELARGLQFPAPEGDDALTREDLVRLFIWRPVQDDARVRAKTLSAHEAFSIFIQAAFLIGIVGASPWIFMQIWSFVGAGLYKHERRYVHIFLPFSVILFLLGVALAFFFVMRTVLNFLFLFNEQMGLDPDPRISEWMSFVLVLPLGFGVAFQLPLVMLFLERIGIFDVAAYMSRWRIAILVIVLVSSVLTPPDPWSLLLMSLPLSALYFGGVLLCRFMPRMGRREGTWEESMDD